MRGEARAAFALDVGALPAAAPGAEIAAGLWIGSFRVEATGTVFPEQRRSLPTGGGDIGLATGALGAWFAPFFKPIELHVGAALEAGAMWGHGFGTSGARSGSAPWVAVRPGLAAAYRITDRLGFSLGAFAAVPLARQRFLLGSDELFVPPPVSLRLAAGLFMRFP